MCKTDLEINDGCLFRGHKVVIPSTFRDRMLRELHSAHFGIVRTKNTARSKMWWPGIDGDIERWVGSCDICTSVRAAPPRAPPMPWPRAAGPWQRIHIDYMTIGQRVYLIVIDSFSKWLECIQMNCGTSTRELIAKLKQLISRFGIPKLIVSDNDVKICSAEFSKFCSMNGIKYITSPIYHPASNGQAENSVKTAKKMLKCILTRPNLTNDQIQEQLLGFLFENRNTEHCVTGISPARLMLGRELRSRLDMILPTDKKESIENLPLPPSRCFRVGEVVWAKWFVARKGVWSLAKITAVAGSRMFQVYFIDYDVIGKRHIDQLLKYKEPTNHQRNTEGEFDGCSVATETASPIGLGEPTPEPSLSQQTRPLSPPPPSEPLPSTSAINVEVEPRQLRVDEGGSDKDVDDGEEEGENQDVWSEAINDDRLLEIERPDEPTIYPDPIVPTVEAEVEDNSGGASSGRSRRPKKKVDYKLYR